MKNTLETFFPELTLTVVELSESTQDQLDRLAIRVYPTLIRLENEIETARTASSDLQEIVTFLKEV